MEPRLSRARPSRAKVPDSRKLAKHEGLQARAGIRPLDGCSDKLARFLLCYESDQLFFGSAGQLDGQKPRGWIEIVFA